MNVRNPRFSATTERSLRVLSLSLAISLASLSGGAYAESRYSIQIPAQPLASALTQLGQQTSLQLFFSPELVANKQAPAVSGDLSPQAALDSLLRGSGLSYEQVDDSFVLRAPTADDQQGSLELPTSTVSVVGNWLGTAEERVVQNHPGARTVIRREAMVEQAASNVRDVLRSVPGVQVPASAIKEERVVLNIAERAVMGLHIDNDAVSFTARFSGVSFPVNVPIAAMIWLWVRLEMNTPIAIMAPP